MCVCVGGVYVCTLKHRFFSKQDQKTFKKVLLYPYNEVHLNSCSLNFGREVRD